MEPFGSVICPVQIVVPLGPAEGDSCLRRSRDLDPAELTSVRVFGATSSMLDFDDARAGGALQHLVAQAGHCDVERVGMLARARDARGAVRGELHEVREDDPREVRVRHRVRLEAREREPHNREVRRARVDLEIAVPELPFGVVTDRVTGDVEAC